MGKYGENSLFSILLEKSLIWKSRDKLKSNGATPANM